MDLEELDHLIQIEPLPSYVRYQDMVDFAEGISDRAAGERLGGTLQGKGAFRRFQDELHRRQADRISVWRVYSDARGKVHAVRWLAEQGLIDDDAAQQFRRVNPEPALP
ncbi:UPF0158 family protein [Nocardioides caeni]|uniref:UPF0158 family protein n=1 Tax=Nocardioides caeni TaxID=574700 RepID=UPI0019310829|nr:UPF0158 family protein [Nocardioides caeni]